MSEPRCPDCGTDLTPVRGRRGSSYLHCWRCDRPMRPGEALAAKRTAAESTGHGQRKEQ